MAQAYHQNALEGKQLKGTPEMVAYRGMISGIARGLPRGIAGPARTPELGSREALQDDSGFILPKGVIELTI